MLGIPTRSNVHDEKYQHSVYIERLRSVLGSSHWPTSTILIHNHVNNAVRHVGANVLELTEKLYKGETDRGAKEVEPILDPQLVLDYYLTAIQAFERNLEEARPHIDKADYSIKSSRPSDNEDLLSTLVHVEDCSEDWMQPTEQALASQKSTASRWQFRKNPIQSKASVVRVMGRKYSYNPYELAKAELIDYKAELEKAFTSSSVKLLQIRAMWSVINRSNESPNKRLVEHIDVILTHSTEWPSHWEWQEPSSEAYKLYEENKRLVAISDLSLRFDEWCWCISNWMIPFDGMFSEPLLTHGKLWNRNHIRDLVAKAELNHNANGQGLVVIINGVTYQRTYIDSRFTGYIASGDSYQEIANLLAMPIHASNNSFQPEEWAKQESALIREYKSLPINFVIQKGKERSKTDDALLIPQPGVVGIILSLYQGFGHGHGVETDQEKAAHVLYTLRDADWKTLYQAT